MATGTADSRDRPWRRVGVFGGTFDPPHVGHVSAAREVADALALECVLWVPARAPVHKPDREITAAAVRREMTAVAAASDARFVVSDVELVRPGPSWTVDTLRELRMRGPEDALFLIVGADQLRTFDTGWREPEEILRLATLAIMDREGASAAEVAPDLPGMERAMHVAVTRVDVSSSDIRARVRAGEDISSLVPAGVLEVILREALYGG
jgi:nicotinate-nucleotide adenylyltransferase